jgi:superfamily II DNA or RNA helicase
MTKKDHQKPAIDIEYAEDFEWTSDDTDAHARITKLTVENTRLRRQNDELGKEIAFLKLENETLRRAKTATQFPSIPLLPRSIPQPAPVVAKNIQNLPAQISHQTQDPRPTSVTRPTEKQIAIFKALFRGRDDVYAKRWESQSKGTAGYSPACAQEWKRPHCTKPQKKCTACVYSPLTSEVISSHFAGNLTVGVYPILPDDTCWFLAVDFDGNQWQQDVLVYFNTCRNLQIPAYLERSRSGNGGHVWIFFEKPTLARVARKLGAAVLTKTMEDRHEIKFTTYDRFFPNQDTMPRGGFGNLIALPLNGKSLLTGNSAFLNEKLRPYDDQWGFLQTVRRVAAAHVETLVNAAEREGAVIGVRLSTTDDELTDPWTHSPSKHKREKKITGPLPESVKIVLGNMIYIEKDGLSSPFLNQLKRLAAFQNPEFYKAQVMRMPIYQIPRVISCADDFTHHLALPRGLWGDMTNFLSENQIRIDLVEKQFSGTLLESQFYGNLREEQTQAVAELTKHDFGILSASTAFGKTVIGAWMIAVRKTNTLVLVHRQELLDQWRERLSTFLGIEKKAIGQIGGGKNKANGSLDIGMIQSLTRKGEVKDIIADYGHVIVDECHHVAAFSFEAVMKQVKAKYILGLTATPTRKDGHHPIIVMQCGPIRYRVDPKKQAAERPFDHFVFPRMTPTKQPNVAMNYQELCGMFANDADRNDFIIADIDKVLAEGRNPLILTERKEHVDRIAACLSGKADHLIVMYGGRTKKEREACINHLRSIPPSQSRILVATGKYIGEGFDDHRLDTLFLALPISWKGTLQQYAGRLHRLSKDKREVRVYDYVDSHVPMAWTMFEKRKRGYRAMGYTIGPVI